MENVIFTDDVCKYVEMNKDYIIESLNELYEEENDDGDYTDDAIMEEAYRLIEFDCDYLKDTLKAYDKRRACNILVVGTCGLWYGRVAGGKICDTLEDAVISLCHDYNTLYYERRNGTLKLTAVHHDGSNEFIFYRITPQGDKFIYDNEDRLSRQELHEALIRRGLVRNIRCDELYC